jgi:hypothetical protein
MDQGIQTPFKKFEILLREIKTGESKQVILQINHNIKVVKLLIPYLFDDTGYELVNIKEMPSIVQIQIEPYCTN